MKIEMKQNKGNYHTIRKEDTDVISSTFITDHAHLSGYNNDGVLVCISDSLFSDSTNHISFTIGKVYPCFALTLMNERYTIDDDGRFGVYWTNCFIHMTEKEYIQKQRKKKLERILNEKH